MVPPVYVEIRVDVVLRGGEDGLEETLREQLSAWLASGGVGGTLRSGDAWALVQAAPGVLQVRDVSLATTAAGCYQNEEGDISLPRRAIPRLERLRVERLPRQGEIR